VLRVIAIALIHGRDEIFGPVWGYHKIRDDLRHDKRMTPSVAALPRCSYRLCTTIQSVNKTHIVTASGAKVFP
jgi:hypothetical protein